MAKPVRIQRSRAPGSKLPPNTVCVTRGPGMKWGNPFIVGEAPWGREPFTVETSIAAFREWIKGRDLSELRGKNLACWCKLGAPCHADVLLELAND